MAHRITGTAFAALLVVTLVAGCRDDSPAPAQPQSTAQAPERESIRRPEQAIDPVERAKGVEAEVLDAKAKQDDAIEEGGG